MRAKLFGMAPRSITAEPEVWRRIAEQVRAQRLRSNLTIEDVVTRSKAIGSGWGVSRATVSLIENGRQSSYAERSLQSLSVGLGWTPESVASLVEGGEAETIEEAIEHARAEERAAISNKNRMRPDNAAIRRQAALKVLDLERMRSALAETAAPEQPQPDLDLRAPVSSFAQRAADALRTQVSEIASGLSYANMYGAAVAMTWLKGRDEYGPNIGEWMEGVDGNIRPAWQELAPSLDKLIWQAPPLEDLEPVILGAWRAGRERWDEAVQEAIAAGIIPIHTAAGLEGRPIPNLPPEPDDLEDHALAAASGEDPTSIPNTPTVNRPSPDIESDEHT